MTDENRRDGVSSPAPASWPQVRECGATVSRPLTGGSPQPVVEQPIPGERWELLEASCDWYRELYEQAPIGYLTMDGYGVIEEINVTGSAMLGVELRWVVGRPLLTCVAEESRRCALDHLHRCRSERGPVVSELWFARPGGDPVYVQVISQRSEGALRPYYRTALVDQTKRYTAEETARRRQMELEALAETLKLRADQLRAVAIQLSNAEQRERRKLADLMHEDLQQLLVGARMRGAMLDQTGVGDGSNPLTEMNAMLDDAIQVTRSLSRDLCPRVVYELGLASALRWAAAHHGKRLHLRVHVDAEEQADVECDDVRAMLLQAIGELLLNVAKHAGASEAWVRSRNASTPGQQLELEVEDRGRGFDPALLEADHGPTGFGLFGMRERFMWLGGGLRVRRLPDGGTCVTLCLPKGASVNRPSTASAPATALVEQAETGALVDRGCHSSPEPIRVLVADDSPGFRQSLVRMIERQNDFTVVGQAGDGKQAVERARALEPNVVLMDVYMPGGSGIEATAEIAREMRDIRVIGFTVHPGADVMEAMSVAGAETVLCKCSAPQGLIDQLRAHTSPAAQPAGGAPPSGLP